MKLHNVDSRLEFPGVGALELQAQTSAISTSPVVLSDNITMLQSSARTYLGLSSVTAADRTAPLGPSPSPSGSSGADQLQAHVVGPLSFSSSALSPTALLFPLTPSPSFPPSLSSSLLPPPPPPGSSLSSYSSAVSSLLASVSSSSSSPIPSLSPAFTPSSLASASYPSSSFVSPTLPPSASSLFPPSSSSSSLYHNHLSSSSSFLSSSLPSASASVSSHPSVPPPSGFPASSFSSQAAPSSYSSSTLPPPPLPSYASASSFLSAPAPPLSGSPASSSLPLSSSSSSSFGAVSSLADHQARLLGLSSEYQSLPRWFLTSGVVILRLLCDPPSLTSYLTCHVISPLAPLSSSPPCARHLPPLPPLLPLLHSLVRLTLPSPLTCRLPTSLVSSLRHPLPRCLPPFLRLLLLPLPSRLLLASPPPFCFYLFGVGFFSYGTRVGCGCPASFWGLPLHG